MATSVLPGYSPRVSSTEASAAPRPPTYSLQPTEDEETVAITPRAGVTNPQGHFIREWPQATLILRDQDPQARLPTYGRGGRIVGELGLTNPDKIDRVTVKVCFNNSTCIWAAPVRPCINAVGVWVAGFAVRLSLTAWMEEGIRAMRALRSFCMMINWCSSSTFAFHFGVLQQGNLRAPAFFVSIS